MIQTERLELLPLTARQLQLWAENTPQLEKELNCKYQAEPLDGVFLKIVNTQKDVTQADQTNYKWHTFWFLVRKVDRVVVGSADFKDVPNAKGDVEIGYGLGDAFYHCGYMTEAIRAMCDWARKQENVCGIIAETEKENLPSQRVLLRCGFVLEKKEETYWWRLKTN